MICHLLYFHLMGISCQVMFIKAKQNIIKNDKKLTRVKCMYNELLTQFVNGLKIFGVKLKKY